jgi:hypothetical protein
LKIAKLTPVVPGLILTACYTQTSPPVSQIIGLPSGGGQSYGIDMATDASVVLNELKGSRVDFVARYYREPGSRWPALSAGEAQLLSLMGLKIIAVWEWHSRNPAYFSYSSGYGDGMTAYLQARAIGQPLGSAIYFVVDYNARSLDTIEEYFRGIAAGLAAAGGGNPSYAIGVYGSGAVCDVVKRTGLAQYSWLSNSIAWAGSIGYDNWNIRQGSRVPGLSFDHDSDEARDEYGAFQLVSGSVAASGDGARPGPSDAPQLAQSGRPAPPSHYNNPVE